MLDDLTEEQLAVATAAPSSRQLVTAGPGTGKTHTLVGRVASLVEDHGLPPGSGILALSFSRAAVKEMKGRLRAAESDAAYVSARTFDSFATWLLAALDPDGSWASHSYDGRIVEATKRLAEARHEGVLADVEHVIVDEAQDLVGARAEFVIALLGLDLGGFTVFGDPAQGIYNFQLPDLNVRAEGSKRLFSWIRSTYSKDLIEASLTTNFRARTQQARAALKFGPMLNGPDPDYDAIEQALRTVLTRAQTLGKIEDASVLLKRQTNDTGVLCRTNGEALVVSQRLAEAEVAHSLRRAATDRVVGRWVADALGCSATRIVQKATVISRLGEVTLPSHLDVDGAWRLLKRMDAPTRRRTEDLDLGEVASRIRVGNVLDDLVAREEESVIVSTIHRAKGLEFDRVLVIEPFDSDDEDLSAEEARTLFVALTRPRDDLFHVDPLPRSGLKRHDGFDERWVRLGFKSWQRFGIEIRGHDSDAELPPGEFQAAADPVETQKYIANSVAAGDALDLRLRVVEEAGNERVYYEIFHDDTYVGVTNTQFGASFFGVLKVSQRWTVNWPPAISQVRVEGVDTVGGTEAAGVRAGLGPSGLWLRVRPFGLGKIDWGSDE